LRCPVAPEKASSKGNGIPPSQYELRKIQVDGLPTLVARSDDPSDVWRTMSRTSLETIIPDRSVCCEKDSALEHSLQRTDPMGVKEVAAKLQGRHLLSDRRAIEITAATPIGRQLTALS